MMHDDDCGLGTYNNLEAAGVCTGRICSKLISKTQNPSAELSVPQAITSNDTISNTEFINRRKVTDFERKFSVKYKHYYK
jgi:hypothetical protein